MDVGSWLEAYRQAWQDKNVEAAAALFDEQATYRANIFETPYEGRDGVRRYGRKPRRRRKTYAF